MKTLFTLLNAILLIALVLATIWLGSAIGQHEEFQRRMPFLFFLQMACIAAAAIRRFWLSRDPQAVRAGE